LGSWQWSYRDGSVASVLVTGGRDIVTLDYRVLRGGDWQSVNQPILIRWTPCRFGGERPWFVCNVSSNGVYCGKRVAKLFGGGRFFACRHCYRLGYALQRGGPVDRVHHRLARLHRKLGVDYKGPDTPPPPKPKLMRWKTYARIVQQIEAGQEQLNMAFIAGARRILARKVRAKHHGRGRRWTRGRRRLR
jgi:hypothetical protein